MPSILRKKQVYSVLDKDGEIHIDLSTAKSAGGQTGSVSVKGDDQNIYQYKPPIANNTLYSLHFAPM